MHKCLQLSVGFCVDCMIASLGWLTAKLANYQATKSSNALLLYAFRAAAEALLGGNCTAISAVLV